jgi:hypothetical protein
MGVTNIEVRNLVVGWTASQKIEWEAPLGAIDWANTTFVLSSSPISETEKIYLNGVRLKYAIDYTLSSNIITLNTPPFAGEIILVDYNF